MQPRLSLIPTFPPTAEATGLASSSFSCLVSGLQNNVMILFVA